MRPGGLVAAAAIGRYASLFEHTATTWLGTKQPVPEAVADILRTGIHEPGRIGFTAAYFHTADELAEEMTAAGLTGTQVIGIEGPSWSTLKAAERHTGERLETNGPLFTAALDAARIAENHPDLLAASSHMLAIAHMNVRTRTRSSADPFGLLSDQARPALRAALDEAARRPDRTAPGAPGSHRHPRSPRRARRRGASTCSPSGHTPRS